MRGSAVFRTGVAPGGALAGPWVRDPLWTRARAVPSLDLRFADNKSLVDATTGQNLVTFTRASNGTFVGSNGVLQTASTDAPRFDHNPITGESLGLLVEEQRANLVTNSSAIGAATGTPGTLPTSWGVIGGATGLTSEVSGIGTENGIPYVDFRFSGTAGNNFLTIVPLTGVIGYVTGTTYTASIYTKLVAGAVPTGLVPTLRIRYNLSPSGSTDISTGFTISNTGSLIGNRFSSTGTTTGTLSGAGLMFLQLNYTSGQVVDFTIRIGLPQLEQGAFATSVIPTTTAAATRSADVASITGSAFSRWYSQSEGTVFVSAHTAPANTIAQQLHDLSNSATPLTDRTFTRRNTSGGIATAIRTGNVLQVDQSTGVTVAGSALCAHALSYAPTFAASAANGAAPVESSITTYPTVNQIALGQAYNGVQYLNGHIRRLTYWPTRLANSTLQTLTQ